MWVPEFTVQEILNVLEDKVGIGYATALKDHLESMKEENDERVKAVESELNAQENYDYSMRSDFQEVVGMLNELNKKARVTRKELASITRQANMMFNNY